MITLAVSFTPLANAPVAALDRRVASALSEAISRGLDEVAATARANVAALRDPDRPSSSPLAASIQSEVDPVALSGTVQAGGGGAPYAAFVEFGTVRSPAQPFLTPALSINADRIRTDIAMALNSTLGGQL